MFVGTTIYVPDYQTSGDLLENYCRADHMMNVARLLFCLTILMTAPIECFVARDIITNTFSVDQNKKLDGSRSRGTITSISIHH